MAAAEQATGRRPSYPVLLEPGEQLRQRHRAALARYFLAPLEQDQTGDRTNAELARQLRIGLAVQFGQSAAALQLSGGLGEDRYR